MCHKKIYLFLLSFSIISLGYLFTSCNNSNPLSKQSDNLNGLTESQQELISKMITLLKDKSKITSANAIGFPAFVNKEGKDFTDRSNTISKYTEAYLSDFFRITDLTEFPVTDADKYYQKYVNEKCKAMAAAYPTSTGVETKSILVSTDSLDNLVSELKSYQQQTGRKTGVRVVFANYDDIDVSGTKKSGNLTYFMVGTVDTLATASSTFNWQFQKDLTILGAGWNIPAWGLSAYNHGELCPQQCDLNNTNYYQ